MEKVSKKVFKVHGDIEIGTFLNSYFSNTFKKCRGSPHFAVFSRSFDKICANRKGNSRFCECNQNHLEISVIALAKIHPAGGCRAFVGFFSGSGGGGCGRPGVGSLGG